MWRELDQPFSIITLLPVESPNANQIQVVRALSRHAHANLLEIRAILQQGGFCGFGELLPDELADVTSKLDDALLPHRVERSKTSRGKL